MSKKDKKEDTGSIEEVKKKAPKLEGKLYTYVGGGEDSPRVINFMGKQTFVRGKAVEVTDPDVLNKLENHPTFVEGEVDQEELHKYDETAKKEADEQRVKDRETNEIAKKKFGSK